MAYGITKAECSPPGACFEENIHLPSQQMTLRSKHHARPRLHQAPASRSSRKPD